ncbi:Alpha/Beta hydrolase protein [Immersiella caudata]|uniref:Alpha/Beta hydrolase protein n=1 Tax=Immersiella caudata TaxID=314043 RepID=A0AA40C210_9PEZI|nr:Alpha/Beta hydrolase protein [Immersiella caudata]
MMLPPSELQKLSSPHPELGPILRANPGAAKPILTLTDLYQARAFIKLFMSILHSSKPKNPATYKLTPIQVPTRDGTLLSGRVYSPKRPSARGCPVMYVCHGGGYVLGELAGQEWMSEIWVSLGGIAVDVLYRHAPEVVFPVPVWDAVDGFNWMLKNAKELGINPSRGLVVFGDSNGADMALVIAHLHAQEQPEGPKITGLYLACPVSMIEENVPEEYKEYFLSMEHNTDAPGLTAESVRFVLTLYKPDITSPLAFPILFPDHSKLPKTYVQVAGMDPLRDGGLILEQVLKDSGVQTKLDVYPGLPHCFWGTFMHADFTKQHAKDSAEALKWLLE